MRVMYILFFFRSLFSFRMGCPVKLLERLKEREKTTQHINHRQSYFFSSLNNNHNEFNIGPDRTDGIDHPKKLTNNNKRLIEVEVEVQQQQQQK